MLRFARSSLVLTFALCLVVACSDGGDPLDEEHDSHAGADGGPPGDGDGDGGGNARDGGPDSAIDEDPWTDPPPPEREAPHCVGVPLSCSGLTTSECLGAPGCELDGECDGVADSCYAQFDSISCAAQDGCLWVDGYCTGTPRSCFLISGQLSCLDQNGCRWDDVCTGSAGVCESLSAVTCTAQPGCTHACELGQALCDAECVDLSGDVEHCGECGFECGPRSRCSEGLCECGDPYTQCDGRCVDMQENNDHCGACGNRCDDGFVCSEGSCVDLDECVGDPCNDGRACMNEPGGFRCGACAPGLRASTFRDCEDIDECATDNGGCDPRAACYNSYASSSCGACPTGFTGTGATACVDIDECVTDRGGCEPRRACINNVGGFQCGNCPAGYTEYGDLDCIDVDECAYDNGGCDPYTYCTNTDGGRECGACPEGFVGDGETGCIDVDECATNNGGCDSKRTCYNETGYHYCGDCPSGYYNDGERGCVDIDECGSWSRGGCSWQRECVNTDGSHHCGECPEGYGEYGFFECADIDQCATNNGDCDPRTPCTDYTGYRTCGACPEGFSGTGATGCVDIDECATDNGGCDPLTACTNTEGGSTCGPCPAGYVDDGGYCAPVVTAVRVSRPASLGPALDGRYLVKSLEWAPLGEANPTVAFEVAEGVTMQINDVETPSGTVLPALEDGAPRSFTVTLTGANGRAQTFIYESRIGCGVRAVENGSGPVSIASDSNAYTGRTVAVGEHALVAGIAARNGWDLSTYAVINPRDGSALQYVTANDSQHRLFAAQSIVDLSGDTLAVGFPGAGPRDGSIARGLVEVRDRQANGAWLPVWSGEGPAGQANYGDAVAIHGDLLAVAGYDVSTYEGRVSVLRRQGQAYALEDTLELANNGIKLAWLGEKLAVTSGGVIKVYQAEGGDWAEVDALTAPDASPDFASGVAHDAVADRLVVGTGYARADIFAPSEQGFELEHTIEMPSSAVAKGFGTSVAAGDRWVAVGAPYDGVGSVYVYWLGDAGPELCSVLTGADYADHFGAGLDGQGKLLGVGAPGLTYGYGAVLYSVGDWNLMP